jgi:NADH-quinone oxidoreductase subunit C
MFRKYTPKDDVQKKSYYTDRFYVTPTMPKKDLEGANLVDVTTLEENGIEIIEKYTQRGQAIVYVKSTQNYDALKILKEKCGYESLMEVTGIDRLAKEDSFEVAYEMLSYSQNKRIRIKIKFNKDVSPQSVASLYSLADWGEREQYDLMGIVFNNHPNMKRVIMPDDWVGHPLRKTYPLQGDEFAKWYEVDKIYGKENREVIGEELRDAGHVDRYDTKRFSRLGYEVPNGAKFNDGDVETPIEYLTDGIAILSDDFDPKKQKILKERK